MPCFAELLTGPLASVAVARHAVDAVALEQRGEVLHHAFGREGRLHFAHRVQDAAALDPRGAMASVMLSAQPPDGSTKARYWTPGSGGSS